MDIQGWLQDTADRAPPNPSDEVDARAFGPTAQGFEATNSRRYRPKRKRANSDSSIIAPQKKADLRGKADDRPANATRGRRADVNVTQSNSSSRHHRPRPQDHGTDGGGQTSDPKTYERRARHKTKPDRYESKKQNVRARKENDDAGVPKPKRKRSQAHRRDDGNRTESLVQGFKLKSGPSNSRLTV